MKIPTKRTFDILKQVIQTVGMVLENTNIRCLAKLITHASTDDRNKFSRPVNHQKWTICASYVAEASLRHNPRHTTYEYEVDHSITGYRLVKISVQHGEICRATTTTHHPHRASQY